MTIREVPPPFLVMVMKVMRAPHPLASQNAGPLGIGFCFHWPPGTGVHQDGAAGRDIVQCPVTGGQAAERRGAGVRQVSGERARFVLGVAAVAQVLVRARTATGQARSTHRMIFPSSTHQP